MCSSNQPFSLSHLLSFSHISMLMAQCGCCWCWALGFHSPAPRNVSVVMLQLQVSTHTLFLTETDCPRLCSYSSVCVTYPYWYICLQTHKVSYNASRASFTNLELPFKVEVGSVKLRVGVWGGGLFNVKTAKRLVSSPCFGSSWPCLNPGPATHWL